MSTPADVARVAEALRARRVAYGQLLAAARALRAGRLFWTEAALLALVEALAERRIDQLAAVAGGGIVNEADLGNDG